MNPRRRPVENLALGYDRIRGLVAAQVAFMIRMSGRPLDEDERATVRETVRDNAEADIMETICAGYL